MNEAMATTIRESFGTRKSQCVSASIRNRGTHSRMRGRSAVARVRERARAIPMAFHRRCSDRDRTGDRKARRDSQVHRREKVGARFHWRSRHDYLRDHVSDKYGAERRAEHTYFHRERIIANPIVRRAAYSVRSP